jgi:homoserine dehydrogenase
MQYLGLLGFGTVGQGVYEIINLERGVPLSKISLLHIKKILIRNLNKERKISFEPDILTLDYFNDILGDEQITTIISVMGGFEPEYSYIKAALKAGKNVVTANKEVISKCIDELLDIARENGVHLLFEASVGGGIPIIDSIVDTLRINRITRIQGILNGTTNFILTKIDQEKRSFDDVLAEAQAKGFAEADPSADVDGLDVMRKISILASLSFKTLIKEEDVHLRGIGNITLPDILMADYFGYKIKYIGQALLDKNRYSVSVTPVLVSKSSVVANVNSEYNIVLIDGDIIGQLCFMGKGAGKDATANAVVSDVLKIIAGDIHYSHLSFDENMESSGITGLTNEYYVRVTVNGNEQFSSTIDLISTAVGRDRMIVQNNNLYFITELIKSSDMKDLFDELKGTSQDVFYARLDRNLL